MGFLLKRTGGEDFPDHLKMLISGSPKGGKALRNDQRVLTPRGWIPISDIKVGDAVIGSNGRPTQVVGVFPQGVRPMYEVVTDDGQTVFADAEHVWTVCPHSHPQRNVTTIEVAKHLATNKRFAYLPMVEPIATSSGDLDIDPYLLGLLLGDGGFTHQGRGSGTTRFHKPEPELHRAIQRILPEAKLSWNAEMNALTISDAYRGGSTGKLVTTLISLGLWGHKSEEKFIPEVYKWASADERFALIQGLMDTDGGMNGKSAAFYTSSPQLRDDFVDVVRSLGGVATVRTKLEPHYSYKGEDRIGRPAYNISVRLPEEFGAPFRLGRKIAAWSNGARKRPPTRRIVSVRQVDDAEATCIKVAAEDGLFVTEGYVVTHNTSFIGTVPNIIVADTEPHANNLQSIAHLNVPYLAIHGTADLQQLLTVLRDDTLRAKVAEQAGMPKVEAVAIDTLDTLQQIMKNERLKEVRRTQFQRDDWGWLKEEMTQLVKSFTELPMHVLFTVHTKTIQIGDENDGRTIMRPGLEGAIAESIAGMVGYSLLAFRRQEIRSDGSPYTKYWLRAEGDENYDYLGNRTAGRLPDVIEPSFAAVHKAAMQGRQIAQQQTPTPIQVTGAQAQAVAAEPAPAAEEAQASTPPTSVPAAPTAAPPVTPSDDSNEPINDTALPHVAKVFEELGMAFPEAFVRQMTMKQARDLVRMWRAIQGDHADGRVEDPKKEMIGYLEALLPTPTPAPAAVPQADTPVEQATPAASSEPSTPPAQTTPIADPNGTIPQILAYVDGDAERAQEIYDAESEKPKPRLTLINALIELGAQPEPVMPELPEEVAEPVDTAPASSAPEPADQGTGDPTVMAKAEETVYRILGGVPVDENGTVKPCEQCGNPVDDTDIAQLAKTRFQRWLCTDDYVAATKAPK